MTDLTLTSTVTNSGDQPYLSGNLFPISDELDVAECEVEGEIPAGLNGSFIRNGPNPMFEPMGKYHMFDGDGMLHSINFADGKASYRNRWIRSAGLEAEMRAGRTLYGGLTNLSFPDPDLVGDAGMFKNVANTHIIRHAGKLLALWEGGLPTEVTPGLETVGTWDFAGRLDGPMTAHPKIDAHTGELFFFGYQPFPPFLRYHHVDADGALVNTVEIDLPEAVMIHDFVMTEHHVLFLDSPVVFNPAALDADHLVEWKPEKGTRMGVMPREGREVRWFEVEPGYVVHFFNGWTEGDRVTMDGSRHSKMEFGLGPGSADTGDGQPARFWADLTTGQAGWERLDDMRGDFTRINDDYAGRKNRYHYMAGFVRPPEGIGQFDSVVKYDLDTGSRAIWDYGPACTTGEAVFAPDPSGDAEDDGWLISCVYDRSRESTDVAVLDARDVEAGPVAQVRMPRRLPFGFHANWFPDQ